MKSVSVHLPYRHRVRAVTVIPDWSNIYMRTPDWSNIRLRASDWSAIRLRASDWTPCYPSRKTVTSMLRMSPDTSSLASGIPCAATLFTAKKGFFRRKR